MNTPTIDQVKTYAAQVARGAKLASIDGKALHTYRDKDGTPLYWRVRLKCNSTGDKFIRPFMWNGTAFEAKEPPAPDAGKPLYGLERLATHQAAVAIICEGENCADALNKMFALDETVGFIALTSGGAQSVATTDWQPLAGRNALVWADNDKAGFDYAKHAADKLKALGCVVSFVDVAALNLPPKGDVVDWLKAFQLQHEHKATAADILALPVIDHAPQKVEQSGSVLSPSIASGEALPLPECVAQADSPTPQTDDEIIHWLATLKPIEYDKVRSAQAKALGIRPATLDTEVKKLRADESEADRLPFVEVEPCPEPIDPTQLLGEVSDTIRKFIVLDIEQAHAAALWVAFTWFIDVVEVAPLAIINAPEKSCGKTQLLTVLGRMAYRPLPASNASASALFRAVEAWKPTILIDEADTFFRDNAELHGMVNAGYLRDGFVLRSEAVGDSFEPRMFPVFSAKALAGIALEKHLPDATMSRGIVFNLRRKLLHESVSRLRHADRDLFAGIAEKLARFAADYSQQVKQARPTLPDALSDRDQDNWDGLLAIASCAGDAWVARAITAALKLSGAGEKTVSTGNELLADIQHVFESKRVDRISTAGLIEALCADEEAAWNTYNRGKPLSPRQLSKRLSEYGINSKNIRLGAYETLKGFELSQFADAFARYLSTPLNLPPQLPNPPQANKHVTFSVADVPPQNAIRHSAATSETLPLLGCGVVADKTPIFGGTDCEVEL